MSNHDLQTKSLNNFPSEYLYSRSVAMKLLVSVALLCSKTDRDLILFPCPESQAKCGQTRFSPLFTILFT